MSANEQYPDTTGLTFEKVWAALMESRRSFEEWKQAQIEAKAEEEAKRAAEEVKRQQLQAEEEAKRAAEEVKRQQLQAEEEAKRVEEETKRKQQQAEEEAKRVEEETKRKQQQAEAEAKRAKAEAEAEEFSQDLKRSQRRLNKQLGELSNKLGLLVESFMSAGAIRRFNAIGYHFTKASTRVKIIDSKTERTRAEADVLLENGDAVIIIEVKTEPSLQDIQEHIRRLQIFREDRNKTFPNDDKKIYGAMAGGIFPNEVQEAALSAGFYVVRHKGDNVKITVPEGFVPKAF